jgi:hypothetical protein
MSLQEFCPHMKYTQRDLDLAEQDIATLEQFIAYQQRFESQASCESTRRAMEQLVAELESVLEVDRRHHQHMWRQLHSS